MAVVGGCGWWLWLLVMVMVVNVAVCGSGGCDQRLLAVVAGCDLDGCG